MIPPAYINAWGQKAPWPSPSQIEQDLILSRLIIEIAGDEMLGRELIFRGGTCLHKLYAPRAQRYSEDLDYVRRTSSGIGPYVDAVRSLADRVGLSVRSRELSGPMVHIHLGVEATNGPGQIRVQVEINIAETTPFVEPVTRPFRVDSPWWSGSAEVPVFTIEELMATKLRALYQRRKGRDLFDLWYILTTLNPQDSEIVAGLRHYMGVTTFSYPELVANLNAKLSEPEFMADLSTLVTTFPAGYDENSAANVVIQRLGRHLKNAPPG